MRVLLHKNFKKQYKKLRAGEKNKFKERRDLFLVNPFHPMLNNHELHGEHRRYRSINITGDIRVHYQPIKNDLVLFITIGKHPDLYGS